METTHGGTSITGAYRSMTTGKLLSIAGLSHILFLNCKGLSTFIFCFTLSFFTYSLLSPPQCPLPPFTATPAPSSYGCILPSVRQELVVFHDVHRFRLPQAVATE